MADAGISEITCVQCSSPLPANAKFCLECGTPVAAAPEREVRKTVTLLFTDVTGSTAMGEVLDPEAYRGVMGRYFDVAREAVERHGGTVEKFVGDAVLAVFGVPDVREDDAVRAVRAAAELNAAVSSLSAELTTTHGVTLAIRTGVNTGSVVAGTARAGGSFATGDAVNTAARLEQAAGPGEILLGAETWQLVRDAVDVEPVEPVTAKGKADPVPAYRLIDVRADEAGRARRLDAPMVGRDRETRALDDALDRVLSTGRSTLVTVLGAPGIGKSRLVGDFVDRVGERADVVSGRCVSYGQGITFFPIVQVIRSALRLGGGESEEVVRHVLRDAMDGAADTDHVIELLLPLLGTSGTPGSHDRTFWAVRRLVEQLAQRRPLVVTVDDLHWAEPTLLELLEQVRDEVADLPLLLVCGARPELLEAYPDWGRGSLNSLTFGLEPFSPDETRARIGAILGDTVPDDILAAVSQWSGGNPLFVEEIVAHLVEEGQVRRTGTGWELSGDLSDVRMPASVSALLAARLDRLPRDERDLLERVSIIGLDFTSTEAIDLAAPSDRDGVVPALTSLARRDLLRRVRGADGDTWSFRHVTIRDAAYDALPKSLRADLHEHFADSLSDVATESAADAGAERLAFVAHHRERAVLLRRELAPHDPALADQVARAVETLAAAGAEARNRDDPGAAAALLDRAVALRHPTPQGRRDALVQLILLGREQYRVSETAQALAQLVIETDETATPLDLVTLELQQLTSQLSQGAELDPAVVIECATQAELSSSDAGDAARVELARFAQAEGHVMSCRWSAAGEVADRMERDGSPAAVRMARLVRGSVAMYGEVPLSQILAYTRIVPVTAGEHLWQAIYRATVALSSDPEGSQELIDAAHAAWTDHDDPVATLAIGTVHHLRGDAAAAIDCYDLAVERLIVDGEVAVASTYMNMAATLRLDRGDDLDAISARLDRAKQWTSPYDVVSVALGHQLDCVIAARSGRLADAREHAERGLATIDRSEQIWNRADLRRQVSEWARLAGETETERRLLTEAREIYRFKEVLYWARWCEDRLDTIPG